MPQSRLIARPPITLIRAFLLALSALWIAPATVAKPTLDVDDFMAEGYMQDVALSPSGQYLAKVIEKNGYRHLLVYDLFKEKPEVVGQIADNIVRPYSIAWANEKRLIVDAYVPIQASAARRSSNDDDFDIDDYYQFTRVFAINYDGSELVTLMEESPFANVGSMLPNDPNHVLMGIKDTHGRMAVEKVNIYSGQGERKAQGGHLTHYFLANSQGDVLYRVDNKPVAKRVEIFESDGQGGWQLFDTISTTMDEESQGQQLHDVRMAGLYQGQLTYIKENPESGYKELVLYDRATKSLKTLASPKNKDVYGLINHTNSNETIGYTTIKQYIEQHYFDSAKQQAHLKLAQLVGPNNFFFTSLSEQRQQATLFTYSPNNPGTFYLFDGKSNKLQSINERFPKTPKENLANASFVDYKARDKTSINALLLIPPQLDQSKKYPLIVMPHGGPQHFTFGYYDGLAQFLATRGYFVLQPNFRGSIGFGREFEQAGYKQWGQLMQDDLSDGVKAMLASGFIDASKVCIVGASYGGYAALMGAIKTPELYQCAVSINGVTDLLDLIDHGEDQLNDDALAQKYLYERIGHPKHDKAQLEYNSPLKRVKDVKVPLLVIAGEKDRRVPFEQSEDLVDELEDLDYPVEHLWLEEAYHHVLQRKKDRRQVLETLEKFLDKHLNKVSDKAA